MNQSSAVNETNIFDEVFCFHGLMNPQGFLLSLSGDVFKETAVESHLLIGQNFAETVYWQAAPHIAGVLQKSIAEAAKGKKSSLQTEFRVSSKKHIFVDLTLTPIFNHLQEVEKISFYALDVTTREAEIRHYKQQSEQFLFAAEGAEIGLWFWNIEEDSISGTPKFKEFFGVAPHETLKFDDFLKKIHPEDSASLVGSIRDSQVGDREYLAEYRVVYADESVQWISAQGKTFYDEEKIPLRMTGIVRRITERKLADEELLRIRASERKALDHAEEANRAKDYFIAFVSHELRSPLNSILGWAKILLTRQVDEKTRQSALETIERSARTQAKLIEDLVDSARITSGKLRLDLCPLNLFEVVHSSFQAQLPAALTRKIDLTFKYDTEQAEVFGDPVRLQQIFTNILTNALKFTPNEGFIAVNLKTVANQAVISFQDSGQGISAEFLPKIFQQFAQADDGDSRNRSGLGLGLAIVKTLVEKQGGTVKAESAGIGKGSTFTVSFPLLAGAEATK